MSSLMRLLPAAAMAPTLKTQCLNHLLRALGYGEATHLGSMTSCSHGNSAPYVSNRENA